MKSASGTAIAFPYVLQLLPTHPAESPILLPTVGQCAGRTRLTGNSLFRNTSSHLPSISLFRTLSVTILAVPGHSRYPPHLYNRQKIKPEDNVRRRSAIRSYGATGSQGALLKTAQMGVLIAVPRRAGEVFRSYGIFFGFTHIRGTHARHTISNAYRPCH
jgi:hypothetical protein